MAVERQEMRTRKKKKKFSPKKAFRLLIVLILAVCVFKAAAGIIDCTGVSVNGTKKVKIEAGMGTREISVMLKENDIIKSRIMFEIIARKGGYSSRLMPGSVEIKDGMSYGEILEAVCTAGRERLDARTLVIPEGYELHQIRDEFVKLEICTAEEFDAACDVKLYDYRFLENLPQRENALEGYLFPDTYFVEENDSVQDVINMMLTEFDTQFKAEYYDRAAELGMSVDEIITLASIIERETDVEGERAKVAGVFYNRLNTDMPLQSCATVQYILKERKPVLSIADTKIDSPYNTYINKGLPVGPIASPGIECIRAALYPEETDALYFVMGSDGKHIFSRTYEEHMAATDD